LNERENFLRSLEFRYPEWVPCRVILSPATWRRYREDLEEIVLRYPRVFGDYKVGSVNFDYLPPRYGKGYIRDNWGCLWHNIQEGIMGRIVEHPLADWKALDTYKPPDPLSKGEFEDRNWQHIKKQTEERRREDLLTWGDGEELFTRLYYLRGFGNLMIDIYVDDPHLPRLIDMLLDYETKLVKKWLEIGVDIINFHTDIGTQNGLMISPTKFRRYIKPMFKELFTMCKRAGVHVYLSSDGRIVDIVDDLIECGVSLHDPQLRANTLEGIEKAYKGKMCVYVDLDEQMFPFCKPEDIRNMVKKVVERLYLPEGGLMVDAEIFGADVPLENIEAIFQAMQQFCFGK